MDTEKEIFKGIDSTELEKWLETNAIPFRELMSYYRCAIMEVETKFNVLNEELSLVYDRNPIETVKTRLKNPLSIMKKINKKGLPMTVENIEANVNDVAGVRVICSFTSDIYLVASYLLKQDDVKLIQVKDYIKAPKPNGYRSLHVIVEVPIFLHNQKKPMRVEVQFRTISMDCWASLEHKIRYKKDFNFSEEAELELLECARLSSELDARMAHVYMQKTLTETEINRKPVG